jgi:hypothetical protein
MTGKEYAQARFVDILARLDEALDVKYGKQPHAIFFDTEGKKRNLY